MNGSGKISASLNVDPFSYSAGGQSWNSHEWLFGLLAFLIYHLAGISGLILAKAVLISSTLALAAWAAKLRGAVPGTTLLVLTGAFGTSLTRLVERPEIISLILTVCFIVAYEKSQETHLWLLTLPYLQMLWANIHGGTALLGWASGGAGLLDKAWPLRRGVTCWQGLVSHKQIRYYGTVFAALIALTFFNPHTYKPLFYGLLRSESPLENKDFLSSSQLLQVKGYYAPILFLMIAVLHGSCFAFHRRSVRLHEWLLAPPLLLLSIAFFRFRIFFLFLMIPALAWHMSQGKWLSRIRWWLPALPAIIGMALIANEARGAYYYRFGFGVHSGIIPVGGSEFIKHSGLAGPMFNSYGIGGYLIWSQYPLHRVFIDGREDVYLKPGLLKEYLDCFDSRERWEALVSKYGIEFAVIAYPAPPPTPQLSLDEIAFPRNSWALVYFDDVVAIYARRNGPNKEVIRRCEYRVIQPMQLSGYIDDVVRNPAQLQSFVSEVRANLQQNPDSFRSHFILGVVAAKRKRALSEALLEFQRTVELNPDFVAAHLNLGSIYMFLHRYGEAEEEYEKALTIEENPLARDQLKKLRSRN